MEILGRGHRHIVNSSDRLFVPFSGQIRVLPYKCIIYHYIFFVKLC
uniref:Uncharacterized protein n=1 Tax=Anguilla anguilla TaxID=7936 RepID=A0A0E9WDK4_ANGAN